MDARDLTKFRQNSSEINKTRKLHSALKVSEDRECPEQPRNLEVAYHGQMVQGKVQHIRPQESESYDEIPMKNKRAMETRFRKGNKRYDVANIDSRDLSCSDSDQSSESLHRRRVRQLSRNGQMETSNKHKKFWNNDKKIHREKSSKKRLHKENFDFDSESTSSGSSSRRLRVRRVKQFSAIDCPKNLVKKEHGIKKRRFSDSESVSESLSESEHAHKSDWLPCSSKVMQNKLSLDVNSHAMRKHKNVSRRKIGKTRGYLVSESLSLDSETQSHTDDSSFDEDTRCKIYRSSRAHNKLSCKNHHYSREFEDTYAIDDDIQCPKDALLAMSRKNFSLERYQKRPRKPKIYIQQDKVPKHRRSKRSRSMLMAHDNGSSEMESDRECTSGSDAIKKDGKLRSHEQQEACIRGRSFDEIVAGTTNCNSTKDIDLKEIAQNTDFGKCDVGQTRSKLHEFCAKQNWDAPIYDCSKESGPPHKKTFISTVMLTTPTGKSMVFEGKEFRDHKHAKDSAASLAIHWLLSEGHLIPYLS